MPTVEFDLPDGPDGVQAKGHATMDASGTITAVIVDSPAPATPPRRALLSTMARCSIRSHFDTGGFDATATTSLSIDSIIMDSFGAGYNNPPTVTISDPTGTGATATANLDNGIISAITIKKAGSGYLVPGMRKFVDTLPGVPGVTAFGANNLGQYLPLAVPDTTTFPGTDYYEIAVVQHREQMHSDLPEATLLREYVQLSTSVVPGAHVALQTSSARRHFHPDPDAGWQPGLWRG